MSTPSKPVKLQINATGAWRNVLTFNAADDDQAASVMHHAAELARIGKASLRIATDDGLQTAITYWHATSGWVDAVTRKPLTD
jgi:hypothetical protein